MSQVDKLKMAKRLVELTIKSSFPLIGNTDIPEEMKERGNVIREKYNELQIELHAKYHSSDQLKTLVNFYESEMGASILRARAEMSKEFKTRFKDIFEKENSENNGGSVAQIRAFSPNRGKTDEIDS